LDSRLLVSALVANVVGMTVFAIVYPTARTQNSLSAVASVADNAILLLTIFAGCGFVLLFVGLARRTMMSNIQAGVLGFGNFTVGIFSLIQSFGQSLEYQDDLAACGGFPPGYWTSGNVTLNRCSIFLSVRQDWVSSIFLLILLSSTIAFWAVVLTRLRWLVGKLKRESPPETVSPLDDCHRRSEGVHYFILE
jgi:hypothetical protein